MERKELAKEIAEHFGTKAKYLGPPTFAFEITTEDDTYTIDRQGIITNSIGETMEADEILVEKDSVEDSVEDGIEVSIPSNDHSASSIANIINMISAKQELIKKAFGTTADFMDKDYARDLSKEKTDTMAELTAAIAKLGYECCPGIAVNFDEATITFRLHGVEPESDKTKAFMELFASISDFAKKLKHSSFKPTQDDNPKYAMRTWLIRLGMVGNEYKQTRKVLLSNLEGNGAFRKVGGEDG